MFVLVCPPVIVNTVVRVNLCQVAEMRANAGDSTYQVKILDAPPIVACQADQGEGVDDHVRRGDGSGKVLSSHD